MSEKNSNSLDWNHGMGSIQSNRDVSTQSRNSQLENRLILPRKVTRRRDQIYR